MILFFIDDSGNTGAKLDHPVEKTHWLVAVAVDESLIRSVDQAIRGVCERVFGRKAVENPKFEVKGSDLFGSRGWAEGLSVDKRLTCYERLLEIIPKHQAKIFVQGINKPGQQAHEARWGRASIHPYTRAFQYLVERIDAWLEGHDENPRGLLVADEQQETGRRMVHQFNKWAHTGTDTGYDTRQIKCLLPALHYVRSVDSRLVQLADCVAFLRNRYEKVLGSARTDSDEAVVRLWRTYCYPNLKLNRVWP